MTKTLCIIDDDDLYKLLLKKTIQKLEYNTEIMCFSNGEEAIQSFTKNKNNAGKLPDIVLLDINMPVMDGWEFMENYKSLRHDLCKPITVYIASSSIARQDVEKSEEYKEISGYLIKPIVKDTIKDLIQKQMIM